MQRAQLTVGAVVVLLLDAVCDMTVCFVLCCRGKMFGFVHLYSGQEAVSTGEPTAGVIWGT